jgi:predicted Zn-dependent protease
LVLFQDQDAEKWMRRAIEIDPDYLEARATLGGMLLDKGALDESIRQLNAVVERDPKHALAWYLLAQALSYTSKAQASGAVEPLVPARKHFSDTISLNPDMAESERAKKYIAKIDALLQSVN